MKRLSSVFLSLLVLVALAHAAQSDGASSAEELASKVQEAIAAKDAKAIGALYDWTGVAPDIAKLLRESIETMLDEAPRKGEVRSVPADFQPIQELGDKRYRQNLNVMGVVTLIYSPADDSATATMPYGVRNGRYYFTAPVVVP